MSDEHQTETTIKEKRSKPRAKAPRKKKVVEVLTREERDSQYHSLRLMVNSFYDLERLRLALENRSKPKKSVVEGREVVIYLAPEEIKMLEAQAKGVAALADGIRVGKEMDGKMVDGILPILRKMPFYREYLKDFEGVGEIGAAIILSQFDIHHADTVSKMWAFAGLAPVPCLRCVKCQNIVEQVDGEYKHTGYAKFREEKQAMEIAAKPCPLKTLQENDTFQSGRAMRPEKGVTKKNGEPGLNYNAWLRSKLLGALGSAQITNRTVWRRTYDDYKHRKLTAKWGVSDAHRHAAAVRYMIKMMLLEIWKAWRAFEGLEVRPSYHEEKLGHVHKG